VILLVDANHGVQAQTLANYYLASSKNLEIVPVLNKIDLPNAQPDKVIEDLHKLFKIEPSSVLKVSAKLGLSHQFLIFESNFGLKVFLNFRHRN
jgi:translation factor GUF1, mitochondrial